MDGSAVSPTDYTAVEQTVTFQPNGNTIAFVSLQTLSDERAELTESFTAELVQPSEGVTITVPTATIDINDATGT